MLTKAYKNREKILVIAMIIFFIIQSVNGYFIQMSDGITWSVLCFGGVVLAFLFALVLFSRSYDWLFCALGLLFTVVADWFLVVLEPVRELPAMFAFNVVQIMYFIRIFRVHDKERDKASGLSRIEIIHISVRAVMAAAALVICAAVLGDGVDLLSMISLFYYANLLCNVVFSFVEFKKNPCFAIGLLCFALCDLFVGLGMIEEYFTVLPGSPLYNLTHTELNLMWVFYVPSYTLISISAGRMHFCRGEKTNEVTP